MDRDERLFSEFMEQGRLGRQGKKRVETYESLDPENGITRLSGSQEDKEARDKVVKELRSMGLTVGIDPVGNILGRKAGTEDIRGIRIGSHIDSVRNGGMFDGNVGVFGGMEAVRRLIDADFVHRRPIEIAVYTGEEGSSFSYGLLGSAVISGKLPVDKALLIRDHEDVALKERMKSIGYLGLDRFSLENVEYHLEMHVEQGPVLEHNSRQIGVVERIVGLSEVTVIVEGVQGHAGTVPMSLRKDPMGAVSELLGWSNATIGSISHSAVATVGRLIVTPNSANVIPRRVEMTIDIRDSDIQSIRTFQERLMGKIEDLKRGSGLSISIETSFTHDPCDLDCDIRDLIDKTAGNLGLTRQRINSGAGHDSQNIAPTVRSGMIFVPSRNGVSHAPMEWTDWDDIENGVKTLVEVVRKLSQ